MREHGRATDHDRRASRRVFLFGALASGLTAAAAGCGGSPTPAAPAPAQPAAPAPAAPPASSPTAIPTFAPAPVPTSAPSPVAQASPAPATGDTPRRGGTLVIADPNGDRPLDPYKTSWHSTAHALIFDRLVARVPDNTFTGFIARDWQAAEDGMSILFRLRDDVKFTDGTPLDAAALKWGYEYYIAKETAAPGKTFFGTLKGVEVVEPYVARLLYETPYAPVFGGLASGEIASPTSAQQYGQDFGQNPVGSGPYKVKEIVPGNQIVYERNEDFKWAPSYYANRGAGYPDSVIIKVLTEEGTTWASLLSGSVHIASVPTVNLPEAQQNQNLAIHKALLSNLRIVSMNTTVPPLDDKRFRQALNHAVDRESVIKNAWDGHAEPVYGPLAIPIPGYYPEIKDKQFLYNPDKAKQIFADLGYTTSGGVLQKDGQPLSLEMLISPDDWMNRAGQIIQAQLKAVGVQLQLRVLDAAARTQALTQFKYQLSLGFYGLTDPDILHYFFFSGNKGVTNTTGFTTDELDRLVNLGRSTLDPQKRFEVYKQAQELIVEAAPWISLGTPYSYTAARKEVQGFKLHPIGGGYLLHDAWLRA